MKTLTQKVIFKNTTPEELYEMYMDAKMHSMLTSAPAKITKKEGSSYSAHGDYIKGKNLNLVPGKLIVQTWRGSDWKKTDLNSIFMLQLEKKGNDAVLNMVHANIPDNEAEGIKSGWNDYYWTPWKAHLAGKKILKKKLM
ncbi:MAG TPA: SRPBCC domain-containing protein [Bacteroidia bacterium]|jgi:activator of HSP90 ATPase|nr:SRPBCC domain-containing protein [Bacteroidia bacterium]